MKSITSLSLLAFLLWLGISGEANAQKTESPEKVAEAYLRAVAFQSFEKAAGYVEPSSLENIKKAQLNVMDKVTNDRRREFLLRRLGLSTVDQLKALTPVQSFVARSRAQYGRSPRTKSADEQLKKTLKFRFLGSVSEGGDLVHVLFRHTHDRFNRKVTLFDMISLTKIDGKWKVSLTAQEPIFKDVEQGK